MTSHLARIAVVCALSGLIAACSSARLEAPSGSRTVARAVPPVQPVEPLPVEAVPSGSVTSEPLAPLAGGGGPAPVIADVPTMPMAPGRVEPLVSAAPGPTASLGSTRSGAVGSYTARDAAGTTCRVSLSSSPALDLYKASASGCANKDLARITAWDFREGEVYLYQPGGSVAARLRGAGGELSGVLAKSGAPLTLSR